MSNTGKSLEGARSRSQIIALFVCLIVFIMLLFVNFAYLSTQSNYDKQYIGHAGELRVLSQRIAKNATEAASGKAAAFKLLADARNDFDTRWQYLKKGDKNTGLPAAPAEVTDELKAVQNDWENLRKSTDVILLASRPCCRCIRWRQPLPRPSRSCRSNRKRSSTSFCKPAPPPVRWRSPSVSRCWRNEFSAR
jgi:hypothetical protein